jgi:serine/threonine-protein kinase
MDDVPVQPGDIIAGKYRVEKVLGRGAMGVVVAAIQVALDRRVCLKFMTKEGQHQREYVERFEREALAAAKLQNQHTAKVLDFGRLDSGAPYIVMEYLDGKDLSATIKDRGPFDVEQAVTLILQACEGLAEAHALGIVHRDVKPANLFLAKTPDGSVCLKVVDFGVAKVRVGDLSLTSSAAVLGSPYYMSPESLNGAKDLDGRTDVWALGVTLYEMLSGGALPFQGDNVSLLMAAICLQQPAPLQSYRPDVPTGLCVVIEHALEKMRDKRFETVSAFAAALAPYAPGRAAPYVERMAKVQRSDVVPARPTDLLPPEPGAVPPPPSLAVVTSVPAATQREPETTAPPARRGCLDCRGDRPARARRGALRHDDHGGHEGPARADR